MLTDPAAFTALAAEWDALHAVCSTATPFQTRGWLASWWRHYGGHDRLRLAVVRRSGRLVALAPMMIVRRGPWWVLSAIGAGISDFADVLVDDARGTAEPSEVREAVRRLGWTLLRIPGWQVIDLREVRPGASAFRLLDVWPGARARLADSVCMQLPSRPIEEFVRSLSHRTGSKTRSKIRKIDALGLKVERVEADEAADAASAVLDLHRRLWVGRGITPEHLKGRFEGHLRTATREMAAAGQAEVLLYRHGDELVAGDLVLVGHDMVGPYLYGVHPEFRNKVDVAVLLLRQNLVLAQDLGLPVLSLLRGQEPYKVRWHPQEEHNSRVLLARRGRLGEGELTGYRALARGRRKAADLVKERMPKAVEGRERLRRARSAMIERGWGG
ncbi:hypothetical protein BIV57_18640 [Mangrovactinospora gilvigrisea]|uniref:BioF2-like acetyltransferase domain-containing protein n=1 Tax=Mangrovactinospora gilvigrisea TaxID=1428644 RepID=A0A1J7C372_9ACTN|nr:hypothetical protein BIV57_18640 [Mangrovactinospora gilvigrisea]